MLRRRLMMAQKQAGPPSRFTRLEYLQGDGTAYINTGVRLTDVNNVEIVFQLPPISLQKEYEGIFGTYNPSFYIMSFRNEDEIGANYGGYVLAGPIDDKKHTLKVSNTKVVMDGFVRASYSRNLAGSAECSLFNRDNERKYRTRAKIFSAKMYKDGTMVRNFVPTFDNETGKPCMLDLLTNTPYYNIGGGEFLYG